MSKLELVRGLYEYNQWANNHVLEAASQLTVDDFSRKQGASFESVEGNLAHIVGAQVVWLQRWTGGSNPKPVLEFQKMRGLPAIRDLFASSHAGLREFSGSLTDERLDATLAYRDSWQRARAGDVAAHDARGQPRHAPSRGGGDGDGGAGQADARAGLRVL